MIKTKTKISAFQKKKFFVIRILPFEDHTPDYTIYLKIMRKEGIIKPCKYLRTYPGPRGFSWNFSKRKKEWAAKSGGEREKLCFSLFSPLCGLLGKPFIIKQILLTNITRNVWEQWEKYAGWYSAIPGLRLRMIWRSMHIYSGVSNVANTQSKILLQVCVCVTNFFIANHEFY